MAELVVAAAAQAPAGGWGAAAPQELLERLKDYGQEGAFALWDELAPEERDFLVRDIQVTHIPIALSVVLKLLVRAKIRCWYSA
jgi:UDP-N-acetylglucosamine/UDP-N-acetylgalactosamine diphosphorylase